MRTANNMTADSRQSKKQQEEEKRLQQDLERHAKQFIGLEELKKNLRSKEGPGYGSLTKFEQWAREGNWAEFGPDKNHYDWWMFPIPEKSNSFDMKYAVFEKEIRELTADSEYMKDYRRGLSLLFQSWGWNLEESKCLEPLEKGQGWNYWDIRLYKAALSAKSFGELAFYTSMEQYALHLVKSGIKLDKKVKDLFGIRV
jgi:hypothetical protein